MDLNFQLTHADRLRLARIADMIDVEAETWREGWCVWTGTVWQWPSKKDPDAERIHVRVVKLEGAINYLRSLARPELLGPSPRMEAAIAAE